MRQAPWNLCIVSDCLLRHGELLWQTSSWSNHWHKAKLSWWSLLQSKWRELLKAKASPSLSLVYRDLSSSFRRKPYSVSWAIESLPQQPPNYIRTGATARRDFCSALRKENQNVDRLDGYLESFQLQIHDETNRRANWKWFLITRQTFTKNALTDWQTFINARADTRLLTKFCSLL